MELKRRRGREKGSHYKPESERHYRHLTICFTDSQFDSLCGMTSRYNLCFSEAVRSCVAYVSGLTEEEQERILCRKVKRE